MSLRFRRGQLASRLFALVLVTVLFCTAMFVAIFWVSP
jgi:hypothetical protein